MTKFKKAILGVATSMTLFGASQNASAFASFWIDPDGAGATYSAFQIDEFLDIVGRVYNENTYTGLTSFNFEQWGTADVIGHDSVTDISFTLAALSSGLSGTFEISGSGVLGGLATGTGTLTLRSGGITIATFDVIDATAAILPGGAPNGASTLVGQATYFASDYIFVDDNGSQGVDYSTINLATSPVFGFSTTNLSVVTDASAKTLMEKPVTGLKAEFPVDLGGLSAPYNVTDALGRYTSFVASGNGQFRLTPVPEPTSIALLGIGLLGLSGMKFRGKGKGKTAA